MALDPSRFPEQVKETHGDYPEPRPSLALVTHPFGRRAAALLLRIWWLPVSLGALALGFALLGPAIGQSDPTLQAAPRLHCTAFARPIVAVEDVSLTGEDTLALGAIVRQSKDATLAAAALPANRDEARWQIQAATVDELEQFIQTYPASAWVPSLRANLGKHYRDIGRYTLALEHWGAAWETMKGAADGPAKVEADYALAHYARLLSEYCRMEALGLLLEETQGRVLDRGPLSQMMGRTREAYVRMRRNPSAAYRCGNLALDRLAMSLEAPGYQARNVLMAPPSPFGLSAAMMVELARSGGLDVMAVERVSGEEVPVPCIVHFSQNHYATVVAAGNGFYQVEDASFGRTHYYEPEVLNAEASGVFVVPRQALPANWRELSTAEAANIWGRSQQLILPDDPCDQPCPDGTCGCPAGSGGGRKGGTGKGDGASAPATGSDGFIGIDDGKPIQPLGGGGGGSGAADRRGSLGGSGLFSTCSGGVCSRGMPGWRVSEPFLNLWIDDVPFAYSPAKGPVVEFTLSYKQRDEDAGGHAGFSSVGYGWNCSWLSYVFLSAYGSVDAWLSGGGLVTFTFPDGRDTSLPNYHNNLRMRKVRDEGDNVVALELLRADGSKDVYGYHDEYHGSDFFLSARQDAQERELTFSYTYDAENHRLRLVQVRDADGRTTALSYDNANNPLLITGLAGPDGRDVSLTYGDNVHLTGITDVEKIGSTLTYDPTAGWPTSLTTPYGTTSFDIADRGSLDLYPVDRYIIITEPESAQQAYVLVDDGSQITDMPTTYPAGSIPDSPLSTLDTQGRNMRNSFYWDRQQSAGLPASPDDFTWAHYRLSRVRHWLLNAALTPSDTLSLEQAPSPDGTTEGGFTWYDYDGKSSQTPEIEGTQILPGAIARVMPDGTTAWTRFERNALGHVTRQTEKWVESGQTKYRTNTFIYSDDGVDLVEHRFGPSGGDHRVVGFKYDTDHSHLPVAMTNAVGEVTSYDYDAQDRLSTVDTPAGLHSVYTYDGSSGYLASVVDSMSGTPLRTNSYTWQYGQLHTHTDDRGLTVTYSWDLLGRLSSLTFPDASTIAHRYTNAAGTMLLDRTATKDRLGNWSYAVYNGIRQVTQVIDPLNRVTAFGYCDCGSPEYVTNAFGTSLEEVTHYVYDDQGRRTHAYFPDGSSVTNTYDLPGRLIVVGDALGKTTNTFDNLSRLVAVSNAVGRVQAIGYDLEDRPVTVTDANGVTVTSTLDDLGRLRTRTYPDTGVEAFGYTVKGLVAYTNQISKVTLFDYDAALRKTTETNANLEVISYQYKPSGDLWKLTDAKSQTTTWLYDEYGRVTNKVDQASVEILRYTYDANSRLTNRWSKAKLNTKYKYDAAGNLTNVDYNASTDIRLACDALNRLTNMVDAAGTTAYKYYAGGLLWTEDGPWASDTVTNYYNAARMRVGLGLAQPTGAWTNGFTYDGGHRLATVISPAGTFTYSYKGPGNLVTNLALPNSSRITNAFDVVGRLTSTRLLTSGNSLLDSTAYVYNYAGQRTNLIRTDNSVVTNTYDEIGQLKVARGSGGYSTENLGYLYDAAWNLNKRTNAGSPTTFSVDSRNQLTGVGATTYSSDNNGNLTTETGGSGRSFTYDDENQLTQVTPGATYRTQFVYDGRQRLRKKIEQYNSGGYWTTIGETWYVYDGMTVIQERNSSNVPTVSYTRGTDLSGSFQGAGGIGGLLARSHGYSAGNWSTHNGYHADGNGNITALVAANQSLWATYRYDPFGNLRASSGSAADNKFRFSSKLWIDFGSLYYYGYRFYDPTLQRWLNRDPLGSGRISADSTGLLGNGVAPFEFYTGGNLHHFVYGKPLDIIDPLGLDVWIIRSCVWPGHEWIVGTNPDGTYWESSFWPDTKSGYGLNCRGKPTFQDPSGFDPNKLDDCMTIKVHVKTSPAVDAKVKPEAERRANDPNKPRYDACGNNCRDYARGLANFARGAQWREDAERRGSLW